MNLKEEQLNIDCPFCKKKIVLTFNTLKCPSCSASYEKEDVHKVFYEYESQVANSNFTKIGNNAEKFGSGMQKTGSAIQQIGCFLFMLPLGIFALYMMIKILAM